MLIHNIFGINIRLSQAVLYSLPFGYIKMHMMDIKYPECYAEITYRAKFSSANHTHTAHTHNTHVYHSEYCYFRHALKPIIPPPSPPTPFRDAGSAKHIYTRLRYPEHRRDVEEFPLRWVGYALLLLPPPLHVWRPLPGASALPRCLLS